LKSKCWRTGYGASWLDVEDPRRRERRGDAVEDLEFAFDAISVPVGRIQYLTLSPMSFREFLLASEKGSMADLVAAHPATIPPGAHPLILEELKTYFFTNGMPECVKYCRELGSVRT